MKKIICIGISFILLSFFSCESLLEDALKREDDSRENLVGVLDDLNKVRGMFAAAYHAVPGDRQEIYFWFTYEVLTDNAFSSANNTSILRWAGGQLSPENQCIWVVKNGAQRGRLGWDDGSFWARYWGGIRTCNLFLENLDNITVSLDQLPQAERDLMRDEVLILRAYYHMWLIGLYGPVPFFDFVPRADWDGWKDLTRPTYNEIANRIADELQAVIDRGIVPMKRDPFSSVDMVRIPMGFAYGLKSRVLLWNASPLNNPTGDVAKYEAAAAAARQFIDLNVHSLETFEDMKRMYIAPISEFVQEKEVILRGRVRNNQLSNLAGMRLDQAVPRTSNFAINRITETPTQEIVDCYELKNGALIIEEYDATHANPVFTPEALAAGYDDVNDPYANRDDRFYRDILFNGNYFGESYQMGPITVWTYTGASGTGNQPNAASGANDRTFTGYYFGKDRDPIYYGLGTRQQGDGRVHQHSVFMRYAEIWLNYAEALCGAGRLGEACDALDMIRLRANQPGIRDVPNARPGDKDWLMKRIINERRVELVVDGYHWLFDVRRLDLIWRQSNNTISGMEITKNADGSFTHERYQIPAVWQCHNERYQVMPIPIDDAKKLSNLLQPPAWR